MRWRSKEEKRRIVEESYRPGVTVASVARAYAVRPCQLSDWRRAYKNGQLTAESTAPTLLPVRIGGVSRTVPAGGAIYIELPQARLEIHGAADPVSLSIVLERLAQ
jgi:transposase-like protein